MRIFFMGFRLIPTSMILNGVITLIWRFSPYSIALLANYVTVVEERPIMSAKYCLTVPVFHFWSKLTERGLSAIAELYLSVPCDILTVCLVVTGPVNMQQDEYLLTVTFIYRGPLDLANVQNYTNGLLADSSAWGGN